MLQGFEPIVEGYSKAPRDLQAFGNGVRVTVETTELFVYGEQGGPKALTLGRQSPLDLKMLLSQDILQRFVIQKRPIVKATQGQEAQRVMSN